MLVNSFQENVCMVSAATNCPSPFFLQHKSARAQLTATHMYMKMAEAEEVVKRVPITLTHVQYTEGE